MNTAARFPASPLPDLLDTQALHASLAQGAPLGPALRGALQHGQAVIQRSFRDGVDADCLVHARSWLIDQLLINAWQQVLGPHADTASLVAVGGYGRGELLPHSDIDLMVLLPAGDHAVDGLIEGVEAFLTLLWDMGLEVGHSVRTVPECVAQAQDDITVITNLVEARWLAGSQALFEDMQAATGPQYIWPSADFFRAKLEEQARRHHKYHDTGYKLEPNVKESPGGLRDIQTIDWVAKRHFGTRTLGELVERGFLTEREYSVLQEGQSYLWRLRFALHSLTGRREDRLLFDYQRTLAEQFGFRDDGTAILAVEQFMTEYYRRVMDLNRLNDMLLQLFEEAILYADEPGEPVVINRRFQSRKGFIEVTDEGVFQRYPFALLEIFLLLAQHPELKGVRATTIRLIRDHCHLIDDDFRNDLRARSIFMEILRQPRGVTHELRRMNRYGVLAAYLPEFGKIVGRMQYDLFHIYTVDEHILFVVRNLRRFGLPEFVHEFPFASRLIQEIPKPELLIIAALFHDIAKGQGGDHSELGAVEVEQFCARHGLSRYDTELVSWLVRRHLLLSSTAQRRDLSDPEVIREFARQVESQQRLDHLYLLTIADIRGTNPELWTSWRDALLLELYRATSETLRRGLENPVEQRERAAATREQAASLLTGRGIPAQEIEKLWAGFPTEYFLRYTPEEIAWHTTIIVQRDTDQPPLVALRDNPGKGGTELFVYTPAYDGLFAMTTALLDQLGLGITDARIVTSHGSCALNTYMLLDETDAAVTDPARRTQIIETLRTGLGKGPGGKPEVTRRQPRRYRHFDVPTHISFSLDSANDRTLLELVTADRPGLLMAVGQAFAESGVRLDTARISTFGSRAEDVFYVTDLDNRPLDEAHQQRLREVLLQHLKSEG